MSNMIYCREDLIEYLKSTGKMTHPNCDCAGTIAYEVSEYITCEGPYKDTWPIPESYVDSLDMDEWVSLAVENIRADMACARRASGDTDA